MGMDWRSIRRGLGGFGYGRREGVQFGGETLEIHHYLGKGLTILNDGRLLRLNCRVELLKSVVRGTGASSISHGGQTN